MVSDVMPHLRHYVTPPLPGPHIVVNVSVVGVKGHGRYAVDQGRPLTPTTETHKSGQYEEGAAKPAWSADCSLTMPAAGTPPIRKCRRTIHARKQRQHPQQDMRRRYPINDLGDDESTGHRDSHLQRR